VVQEPEWTNQHLPVPTATTTITTILTTPTTSNSSSKERANVEAKTPYDRLHDDRACPRRNGKLTLLRPVPEPDELTTKQYGVSDPRGSDMFFDIAGRVASRRDQVRPDGSDG